jgi:probable rRNA maturation factor
MRKKKARRARSAPGVRVFETKPTGVVLTSVARLAESVLKAEGSISGGFLSVILVNNTGIRRLNARYLRKNRATDVIAFPLDGPSDHPADRPNFLEYCVGEVYVSTDRAAQQAKAYDVSMEEELSRLVMHGVLHLSGYDDKNRMQRAEMREREDWHLGRGNWIRMKKGDRVRIH